mgnify:CR=1 FL=1
MYRKYIKNILDFLFALILLILLSPLFLIIAIISKIEEPDGTVYFKQERAGVYNKPFLCFKFRSMKMSAPKNASTWELDNPDAYITPLGKFLRKTSLDEIPQLINILKGDMSFVGPRPVILKEKELLDLRAANNAYSAKPGITGLSQISGRDNLSPKDKAYTDGLYASQLTFMNDLKIFLKTIPKVLSGDGVTEGKQNF